MSVTLHGAVVLLSVFGLPHIQRDLRIEDVPMVVELVTISNETNLPSQPVHDPKPKSEAEIQPKPKKCVQTGPAADTGGEVLPPVPLPDPEAAGDPPPQPALKVKSKLKTEPVLKPKSPTKSTEKVCKGKADPKAQAAGRICSGSEKSCQRIENTPSYSKFREEQKG